MKIYKLIFLSILWCGCTIFFDAPTAHAQGVGTYVVAQGDTLYGISERFGVTVDTLIEVNKLSENGMIWLGQELLIPGDAYLMSTLGVFDTEVVRARPGDTIATLAIRSAQPPELVAALNLVSDTLRLFPGQPIKVPIEERQFEPLRFGAIESMDLPEQVVQGYTGQVIVSSNRAVSLNATWGGMPLSFVDMETEPPKQFALLPVSPMLAPASYPLQLAYVTRSGLPVTRTWYIEVADGAYPQQEILVSADKGALLDPNVLGPEIEILDSVWNQMTPELYWTAPFSLPLPINYQATSPFGIRRSYNGGPYDSFHTGHDFASPSDTPILAPGDGVVMLAQELQIRGNAVIVDHGNGIFTSGYDWVEYRRASSLGDAYPGGCGHAHPIFRRPHHA